MNPARDGDWPTPASGGAAGEFWGFLRAGELRLQRCRSCRTFAHPPVPACCGCGSREHEWVEAQRTGEVWSRTTVHAPVLPAFADRVPYEALVVRLDEGVFMVTNPVTNSGPSTSPGPPPRLEIGDRVELVLHAVNDDLTLPLARPTEPTEPAS